MNGMRAGIQNTTGVSMNKEQRTLQQRLADGRVALLEAMDRIDNLEGRVAEIGRNLQAEIATYIEAERTDTEGARARIAAFASMGYLVELQTSVPYENPLVKRSEDSQSEE